MPAVYRGDLRATLYELGLQSEHPAELAEFYNKAFGYHFTEEGGVLNGVAVGRRVSIQSGPSKTLAYAAYAVPNLTDLDELHQRLRVANVAFEQIKVAGFDGPATCFTDPTGNEFRFGVAAYALLAAEDLASSRPARLQHVVFATENIHRMLDFFTEVVGFTLSDRVEDDQGTLRTFFVRCSAEHHSLAVFAASEDRLDHHCYEAGDWSLIRDWADHLAGLRIPLKWGPGRHGPGNNLFLFIHDPDGNWLEISAELEHVARDREVGTWPHEEYTLNRWGVGLLRN